MDEKIAQDNESEKKASNPYDALFKEVMNERFNELGIPIKTEEEVSRKPRTIDVVVTCAKEEIEKARRETTFDFFSKNNIIGFKSPGDRLTIWEYHKIRGRAHLYIAEKQLTTEETIICAVCSNNPRKVLHQSQDTVEFTMIKSWHYISNEKIPFHVVIISKLQIEYKNYPLLLFAPARKFKEFVKHAIENNRLKYLEYAYLLHPKETKEVLMMTGKIPIPEENVKFIVNDLGIERILRNADIDEVVRCIDVKDLVQMCDSTTRER
ncbi:MAG: hypothetical protein ACE5PV_11545 [Candidatus Poribacteria bacterium]